MSKSDSGRRPTRGDEGLPACGWSRVFAASIAGTWRPQHLGTEQLIKRACALANRLEQEQTLFMSGGAKSRELSELAGHREELADLQQRLGNSSPVLQALTYKELFVEWTALSETVFAGHPTQLAQRDGVTVQPNDVAVVGPRPLRHSRGARRRGFREGDRRERSYPGSAGATLYRPLRRQLYSLQENALPPSPQAALGAQDALARKGTRCRGWAEVRRVPITMFSGRPSASPDEYLRRVATVADRSNGCHRLARSPPSHLSAASTSAFS